VRACEVGCGADAPASRVLLLAWLPVAHPAAWLRSFRPRPSAWSLAIPNPPWIMAARRARREESAHTGEKGAGGETVRGARRRFR
jgi:hypothetical protein